MAGAGSAGARAPEAVAAEFYGWYLDTLAADQDPLSDRYDTFTRYVAKDLGGAPGRAPASPAAGPRPITSSRPPATVRPGNAACAPRPCASAARGRVLVTLGDAKAGRCARCSAW